MLTSNSLPSNERKCEMLPASAFSVVELDVILKNMANHNFNFWFSLTL